MIFDSERAALRSLRGRRSQQYMADVIGCTRTHLSDMERGCSRVTLSRLKQAARIQGLRLRFFFEPTGGFSRVARVFARDILRRQQDD